MPKQFRSLSLPLSLILLIGSAVVAEEPPKFAGPEKEHAWLKQFVGQWEVVSEAVATSDESASKHKGTMKSRMLGGFWIISEMDAEMAGATFQSVQTIGYDPKQKKYVGTWVDSMMNYLWRYEGAVDESGKILTLEAEGPNFIEGGKLTKFRDSYEFQSPDLFIAKSAMLGSDGKWVTFMVGTGKRQK